MNIDRLKNKEKVVLQPSISPDAFERFNWDYRSQLFYFNLYRLIKKMLYSKRKIKTASYNIVGK